MQRPQKVIDDAARLEPEMLQSSPRSTNARLKNSVNIVTAASVVNQVAVSLKVNLGFSNVNTFNPTNYNNVIPVINLSVPSAANASPALCTAVDFGADGAACTRDGDAYVISFDRPSFQSDSCIAADLEPVLSQIGKRIADYRARYGIGYDATIQGFASLPTPKFAKCPEARPPKPACDYVNQLRRQIVVKGCDLPADQNVALSAARAVRAAAALERAGNGAVVVGDLAAKGTETARLRRAGATPASDQTVVIRLTPTPAP